MNLTRKITVLIEKLTGSPDLKRLAENFLSLSFLQAANYLLPLITLPYLVRVLGPGKYGLVMFAQAFTQYFIVLTDYGFDLSATREISVHRDDKKKVIEIFNSVFFIKVCLMSIGFGAFLILVFSFPRFSEEWPVFLLSYGAVLGNVLFPLWFFQGMERMKYITFLNILSKSIFTLAVFLIIRQPSDYQYVPLLNSIGYIVAGLWAQWIVIKRFLLRYTLPSRVIIWEKLKDSSQFFASRVSVSVYTSSNAFVLGLFTTNDVVGFYAAAEKIYTAMRSAYYPLNSVLYPYVAKNKNVSLFKKVFKLAVSLNIVLAIIIFALAFVIVQLMFGDGMETSAYVLQIFAVTSIFTVPAEILGYPFLAALGYPQYANGSVIIGSVFHLIGLLLFAITGTVNIYWVALLVFITVFIVFSIRIWAVSKKKLWELH
jgi:PST family polysaccharide transporter